MYEKCRACGYLISLLCKICGICRECNLRSTESDELLLDSGWLINFFGDNSNEKFRTRSEIIALILDVANGDWIIDHASC